MQKKNFTNLLIFILDNGVMKVPHTTIAYNNNGYFTDIFFVMPFWAYTTVMFAKNAGFKYCGVNPILLKIVVCGNSKSKAAFLCVA